MEMAKLTEEIENAERYYAEILEIRRNVEQIESTDGNGTRRGEVMELLKYKNTTLSARIRELPYFKEKYLK